jgi:hypothetical protein
MGSTSVTDPHSDDLQKINETPPSPFYGTMDHTVIAACYVHAADA